MLYKTKCLYNGSTKNKHTLYNLFVYFHIGLTLLSSLLLYF